MVEHESFVTGLTFPCWIIGIELSKEIQFVIIEANEDKCIPVFTNQELAENFISKWGVDAHILAFDTQSRFVKFLKKVTAKYIVHNPSSPRARFDTFSTRVVLKNLQAEFRNPS